MTVSPSESHAEFSISFRPLANDDLPFLLRWLGDPDVAFGEMQASVAIIAPSPDNRRAIRVYEKVGFRWLKTVPIADDEHPENTGLEYVMLLTQEEFNTAA